MTPIFLHLSFFHILFNMYWTFELGRMVESRKSSIFLICFILVSAVISNSLQYILAGAGFGG
ncbi:MAG: rhomboid family intramembrane serine protease, partial [Opitutae bacterium]